MLTQHNANMLTQRNANVGTLTKPQHDGNRRIVAGAVAEGCPVTNFACCDMFMLGDDLCADQCAMFCR